tara:strand:+ start:156 stop:1088 length:933 start_codon:yes stop_codon:yes gene_type:complete
MSKCTGPRNAPAYAGANCSVPLYLQQQLRLGYYSAVTHSDALFGSVIDKLDELGLKSSTVVIVTGDHGWQLGEHSQWGKHTNWELGVHVPIMIRTPWLTKSVGAHSKIIVTLVDMYRTLASLTGIDTTTIAKDVDGIDFAYAVEDPSAAPQPAGTVNAAYSQYSRCPGARNWPVVTNPADRDWFFNNCEGVPAPNITFMGYTVRTNGWRYTEWFYWNGAICEPDFVKTSRGAELYDHTTAATFPLDMDVTENVNVVAVEANAKVVSDHRALLLAHFQGGIQHKGCPGPVPHLPKDRLLEDSDAPNGVAWL